VNFTSYDNVNQFLVSLNGILQSPTDSFTVSGSTLTFASNLSTGDVIDFVMVLGNTLDVGTPSDNTVSLAKLTATGTKSSSTFLRGDNTFNSPSVASLSTASGSAPSYSARAWVNFNGTGTPAIRASGNVSSITDVSTGRYKVNFTTNMPDANYAVAIASQQANNNISQVHNVEAPNVAYVEFQRKENDTNYDSSYIFVTVTR